MSLLSSLRSTTPRYLWPSRVAAEMEELRQHIELRAADLERSGLSREEAARRARSRLARRQDRAGRRGGESGVRVQDVRLCLRRRGRALQVA
jgi:hypothetical protein